MLGWLIGLGLATVVPMWRTEGWGFRVVIWSLVLAWPVGVLDLLVGGDWALPVIIGAMVRNIVVGLLLSLATLILWKLVAGARGHSSRPE